MTPAGVANRMNGMHISESGCGQSTDHVVVAPAELPSESPEIHALLAKLQDVASAAGGSLEPSSWGGEEDPTYVQTKPLARGQGNGEQNW
ncbi:unnamed protein product, partial [Laminaria digitata]